MHPRHADMLVYRVESLARSNFQIITRQWIDAGPAFWYRVSAQHGFEFMYADPVQKERRPAFDHARLAAAQSTTTGKTYAPYCLPFETIELVDHARSVRFAVGSEGWCCDLRAYTC